MHDFQSASGMSLRDHFAGIALPRCMELCLVNRFGDGVQSSIERATEMAYQVADAMIATRLRTLQDHASNIRKVGGA